MAQEVHWVFLARMLLRRAVFHVQVSGDKRWTGGVSSWEL